MKRKRVYELYPVPDGHSAQSVEYHGYMVAIAAVSIKQAFYFAYNFIWANVQEPLGILYKYQRDRENGDHLLPSGEWAYPMDGFHPPRHDEGITVIRTFLKDVLEL